jgi:septal ring factor EnvC (AmiA/AmiB activator)
MRKIIIYALIGAAIFSVGFFLSKGLSYSNKKILESQVEKLQETRDTIDKEKEKLKLDLQKKEESVELKNNEILKLQDRVSYNEKIINKEKQKNNEIKEAYDKEIVNISSDIDNFNRCLRLCASRAELGYPCAADFCSQFK